MFGDICNISHLAIGKSILLFVYYRPLFQWRSKLQSLPN